ncbi:transglycosylase domain-containing protein [Bacillus pseudomycoides]|uniref:transglycosylase domain-containing protein n=1 Tax=Bacillus pseudomycoides TaxID=64104 RepID=UPI000BEDDFC8|nr:PBP1A family penicillin-binding protein [Bacillus pseudomycoides]PDY45920.1 penicillin-binding protein [Bacillus pseudomycoides]PEA81568.1 penicillin-binding protein [Bacillus pseudomycoides]PED05725.1 penicillin-binding protein [Bacillus pseudomycoides]PED70641.1 penicillin-binding protein [Bacillus pseudomycoides]PEI37417.1 penicillin-binding protein [Bacillus pseudomycoides]
MKKIKWSLMGGVAVFVVAIVFYKLIVLAGGYIMDEKRLVFHSSSRIVDQRGKAITKLYVENRELVPIERIPKHVAEAFIAVEDARFYEHYGIDYPSVFRALYKDILAGEKVEGGSTITQQLVKNVFLTHEKTFTRKLKEVAIALQLEHKYTKQQLLEMYMNHIYFGHGAYGIQAAAKLYFNKDVEKLTVEEGAMLAGLPKAPNGYSPFLYPEKNKERRDLVLSLMHKQGYLSAEESVRYQGKTIALYKSLDERELAYIPYVDMVVDEAARLYGLSHQEVLRGGYTFIVSMDEKIQKVAYDQFQDARNFPGKENGAQGAFLLMDNATGGIKAAIGGREYVPRGFNRVFAKRQPGSVLKPLIVYAPALETKKYNPYSLLTNEQTSFEGYEPRNYNHRYSKEVTMYDALLESANVPAVSLLHEMGVEQGKQYLEKGNIHIAESGLSTALGGLKEGVSPFELVKMYRAFLANGKIIEPHVIEQVLDRHGKVIGESPKNETKVFSKQTAWYMTKMLEGVVKEGTASAGVYNGALAGKTGTTSLPNQSEGARDIWFVGYTPSLVGAVWIGYDRTDKEHQLYDGKLSATELFKKILTKANVQDNSNFKRPKGVETIGKPIRLSKIENVEAQLSFSPFSLFTAKLHWTPLPDKRVVYRIYKVEQGKHIHVGTVKGIGEYEEKFINIFSKPSFYVVPYNPQTNREGEKTKVAKP